MIPLEALWGRLRLRLGGHGYRAGHLAQADDAADDTPWPFRRVPATHQRCQRFAAKRPGRDAERCRRFGCEHQRVAFDSARCRRHDEEEARGGADLIEEEEFVRTEQLLLHPLDGETCVTLLQQPPPGGAVHLNLLRDLTVVAERRFQVLLEYRDPGDAVAIRRRPVHPRQGDVLLDAGDQAPRLLLALLQGAANRRRDPGQRFHATGGELLVQDAGADPLGVGEGFVRPPRFHQPGDHVVVVIGEALQEADARRISTAAPGAELFDQRQSPLE